MNSRAVSLAFLAALAVATFACSPKAPRTKASVGPPEGAVMLKGELSKRITIDHPDALGISGSCRWDGETYLVAERNFTLFRIDRSNRVTTYKIVGLPEDVDLEGLACYRDRFYVSSERELPLEDGAIDNIFVLELSGDEARLVDTITMQYPEGVRAQTNEGLEGLCFAGGWLIAAGESIQVKDKVRRAPILQQKLGDTDTFVHWVHLTTATGKISGLDCRLNGSKIEVYAIERHFEVSRVLQFTLGSDDSIPDIVLDLAHFIRKYENYEAVLVDDRGEVRLANDNQYKVVEGESQEVILKPVPVFAR